MSTYVKIETINVGAGGAASISFSSIPSTYTDLVLSFSAMGNNVEGIYLQFNGNTSNFSGIYLYSDGSNVITGSLARYVGSINGITNTPNNGSIYIPNYAGSSNKSYSVNEVAENNGNPGFCNFVAGLWGNSAAITSITLEASSSFKQYSSFTLYGIKKN